MAKNSESIEGKYVIWGCLECGHNHYIHKDSYTQDGLRCEECRGLVKVVGFTNQKPIPLHKSPVKEKKYISVGNVKVEIDVSDALKGLKAVQREAKKTAQALRVVEGMSPKDAILRFTDDEIFEVLSSRGWEIETAVLSDGFGNPNMSSVNMHKNYKT